MNMSFNTLLNISCNRKNISTSAIKNQTGVGLIEVLVAMLLLASGMLGAVALQITVAKEQRSAQFTSRAALIASEMGERMRSNRAGMSDSTLYMTPTTVAAVRTAISASTTPTPSCTQQSACVTPANTAQYDQYWWWQSLLAQMPPDTAGMLLMPAVGGGAIARDIVIVWREPVINKDANGSPLLLNTASNNNGCPSTVEAESGMRCYVQRVVL